MLKSSKPGAPLGSAPVMLQGSGPGFRNLPVFDAEGGGGAGGVTNLGGDGGGGDFLSTLSDDNKAFASEQGFKDVGSVFDGFRSLQEKQKGMLSPPGQDATPEQRAEFYGSVSKSWTPDNYEFKMPEGLPETFSYDQDFAKEAGGWFKEAGLHPSAAQSLHDKWVGKMAELQGQQSEANTAAETKRAEAAENAHRELVKAHGDPSSDGYKNHVAKADRAMKGLSDAGIDVSSWFAEKGILTEPDDQGLQQVTDPTAVNLMAFLYDKAFTEDGLNDLTGGQGGANPFDKDKPDLQKQSELLETSPARAKQLIEAAGRDPKSFQL
ncbi:MAG: hypothetical protein RIE06_22845 [Roseibium album]|uniref:hypothetical protein n=1 Tax=Roseibium album TaxID=311410 RepID=UPI0032EF2D79